MAESFSDMVEQLGSWRSKKIPSVKKRVNKIYVFIVKTPHLKPQRTEKAFMYFASKYKKKDFHKK